MEHPLTFCAVTRLTLGLTLTWRGYSQSKMVPEKWCTSKASCL
ncbi:hypothetical protein chiPu_0026860, partial [Chiloscyllium punctatum]|nr:hypothetical protein [Chiloscyllium punctatum]